MAHVTEFTSSNLNINCTALFTAFSFLSQNATIIKFLTRPTDRKHMKDLTINVTVCCRPTGTDLVEQLEIKWQSLLSIYIVVVQIIRVGLMAVTLQ